MMVTTKKKLARRFVRIHCTKCDKLLPGWRNYMVVTTILCNNCFDKRQFDVCASCGLICDHMLQEINNDMVDIYRPLEELGDDKPN